MSPARSLVSLGEISFARALSASVTPAAEHGAVGMLAAWAGTEWASCTPKVTVAAAMAVTMAARVYLSTSAPSLGFPWFPRGVPPVLREGGCRHLWRRSALT